MAALIGILLQLVIFGTLGWFIISFLKLLIESIHVKSDSKDTDKPQTHEEPLNLIGMILTLLLIAIIINIKVGFEWFQDNRDYPAIIMAIVPLATLGILLFWNLLFYAFKKPKLRRWGLRSETNQLTEKEKKKYDLRRKFFHILVFVLITGALMAGDAILRDLIQGPNGAFYVPYLQNFWGNTTGIGYLGDVFIRKSMSLSQMIVTLWVFGEMVVLVTMEIARLSNKIHFPLIKQIQKTLRFKEIDTFASYTHFCVGYLFAAMLLPPILFIATLCLITFADPAASTIGIRYGKHRYSWNKKSVEGSLAGVVAAFITMYLFVGPIYALVGALGFLLIDLITPEPIKLSDNIAMPICTTLLFVMLSLLNISAVNVFGY